jgi:hypothetical protein
MVISRLTRGKKGQRKQYLILGKDASKSKRYGAKGGLRWAKGAGRKRDVDASPLPFTA